MTDPNRGRSLFSGFQGAESSGVEVTLYSHGDDPVLNDRPGPRSFIGRFRGDLDSSVVSVTWSKFMGAPSGQFQVQLKDKDRQKILGGVVDDDWVDVSFLRGDRVFHVCRGLVDTVRETTTVTNGATGRVYNLRGRDHGKIWEQTRIYFNQFLTEGVGGTSLLEARFATNRSNIFGDVADTVFAFLREFLIDQENNDLGVNWTLPPGLPNVEAGQRFADVVSFNRTDGAVDNGVGYTNAPPRVALLPNVLDPTGSTLWEFGQHWSDPGFCELYTELVRSDTLTVPGVDAGGEPVQLRPEDSTMAVVLRDRPFPYSDAPLLSGWFKLPLFELAEQDVQTNAEIGRGGEERFNAFFVRGKAIAEFAGTRQDLVPPILDKEDIRRHGFRRYDSQSNYSPDLTEIGWNDFIAFKRNQLRDWFALNPYFYNGTLPLARGFPEIRIGTRVRVKSPVGPDLDQTYYVEGVTHAWTMRTGMKTTLQVTRGWIGDDASLLAALQAARKRFSVIEGVPRNLIEIPGTGTFDGRIA